MGYTIRAAIALAACLCLFTPFALAENTQPPADTDENVVGEIVAQPILVTHELAEAYRGYQLAQLRWQQYRFVDLPRQRQQLDGQVRLLEAEIQVLRRRARDYRPFLQVGRYSPVRTAAENDRLSLLATEQALRFARDEQTNLMRYSRQTAQWFQLEVLRAATEVKQQLAKAYRGDVPRPMAETFTSVTTR